MGQLRSNANMWGGQLAAAGVNLDLAPVLDTVPPLPEPGTSAVRGEASLEAISP